MPSGRAVLVDTGPLVALFDRDDAYHDTCARALEQLHRPLLTVWPVLTEAMHLLAFSFRAQDDLWEFVERGGLGVTELIAGDVPVMRALMRKYRDRPMDLADAALVRLGEREGLSSVFTLDHGDFRTYRLPRGKAFTLIPASL